MRSDSHKVVYGRPACGARRFQAADVAGHSRSGPEAEATGSNHVGSAKLLSELILFLFPPLVRNKKEFSEALLDRKESGLTTALASPPEK